MLIFRLKKDLRDLEIEKEELEKQVNRQNLYIEELVDGLKERDDTIMNLTDEKNDLEEQYTQLEKDHKRVQKIFYLPT